MRRQMGAALAVGAMLAVAIGGTARASGETPEWWECVKAKGVGTLDKGCAGEGGKGGYIARPAPGGAAFRGHGLFTMGNVQCASGIEATEEPPNLLIGVAIRFSSCHRRSNTKYHCQAQEEKGGPKEPRFESEPLSGELGYISRSPLRVGLRLVNAAEPGGGITPRIYCIGPADHFRFAGSLVGEVGGVVNVAGKKGTLDYVPIEDPGHPLTWVDPPLEGEELGLFRQQPEVSEESWGPGVETAAEATVRIQGAQMIKA